MADVIDQDHPTEGKAAPARAKRTRAPKPVEGGAEVRAKRPAAKRVAPLKSATPKSEAERTASPKRTRAKSTKPAATRQARAATAVKDAGTLVKDATAKLPVTKRGVAIGAAAVAAVGVVAGLAAAIGTDKINRASSDLAQTVRTKMTRGKRSPSKTPSKKA